MEPVQTNLPVVARALDFSQEAKRRRELEQAAAAKADNPLNQQHANRVTFSQEAQTRLNEEKTHAANLVVEVRNAARAVAAEQRSKAMSEEHQKLVEARVEGQKLKAERDKIVEVKAEAATKTVAQYRKAAEKTANATRMANEDSTIRAIEQHTMEAEKIAERYKAQDASKTVQAADKVARDMMVRQESDKVVENLKEARKDNELAADHVKSEKAQNDRVRVETAKAMKMYRHIKSMG